MGSNIICTVLFLVHARGGSAHSASWKGEATQTFHCVKKPSIQHLLMSSCLLNQISKIIKGAPAIESLHVYVPGTVWI